MLFFRHKVNHERSIKQIGAAAVVVGGSLLTGIMGASAASSAASTQAAAQQQAAGVSSAAQLQAAQLNSAAQIQAAQLQATAQTQSASTNAAAQQQAAQIAANAQTAASQLQAQTTTATNAQQLGMYNQNIAMQQPWVQAGQGALAQQQAFMAGSGGAQPTLADMTGAMNPMYQFQVDQGNQALQASAAARGGLLTGQGAKDISNYNINAAGAGLQQGYNNYVNNQQNIYNRLGGISNIGQTAAGQGGTMGANMSNAMANVAMYGTAAQNALTVGAGQSLAQGTAGAGLATAQGIAGAGQAQAQGTAGAGLAQAQGTAGAGATQAQGIAGVGAAQSAGIINANNAWTGAINNGMNAGLGIYGYGLNQAAAGVSGQAVPAGQPGATTSVQGLITPTQSAWGAPAGTPNYGLPKY